MCLAYDPVTNGLVGASATERRLYFLDPVAKTSRSLPQLFGEGAYLADLTVDPHDGTIYGIGSGLPPNTSGPSWSGWLFSVDRQTGLGTRLVKIADTPSTGITFCGLAMSLLDDCNHNGIPDECELDSDGDGVIDECEACDGDDSLIGQPCDSPIDADDCPTGVWDCSTGILRCTDDDADDWPTITEHPQDQTVCAGDSVTFSVTATGRWGLLWHQWQKDSRDLSGATRSSYTISSVTFADAGLYRVLVTDDCGTVTSNAARLVVEDCPEITITVQPRDADVCEGGSVIFSVQATGEGTLRYQWRKNGSNLSNDSHISGATSASLRINPVALTDAGNYDVVVSDNRGSATSNIARLAVHRNPTPAVQAVPSTAVCQGRTVRLDAGSGYRDYLWWPDGQRTQTIDVSTGGSYIVTVTDAYGCQGQGEVFVTVNANPSPRITASPSDTVCSGASVRLDAGYGYRTYEWWPGGQRTRTIDVTTSGTYRVTVTDDIGCEGTDEIFIGESPGPTPQITAYPASTVCADQGPITLSLGGRYRSYLWRPGGQTSSTIQVTQTGTYGVTVTDDYGCQGEDEISITVNPSPAPNITATPREAVCAGVPVRLDAGYGYASYEWFPGGQRSRTINVTSAGTYRVTVVNDVGCQGTDEIYIGESPGPTPEITAHPANTICEDQGPITLGLSGRHRSYSWRPDGETTSTIQVTRTGTYGVTVTDDHGCQGDDEISITVNPSPAPNITATPREAVCAGVPVRLDAGYGYASYEWSPGGQRTRTIDVTTSGTYRITVVNDVGCQGTDEIFIGESPGPTPEITAHPADTVCEDQGPITLGLSGQYRSYLWRPGGETTSAIQVTRTGAYGVTVTDDYGCQGEDEISITVNPSPVPEIAVSPPGPVCEGQTLTLDAGPEYSGYVWSPGGQRTRTIEVTESVTYAVTVTDHNGCVGTADFTPTFIPGPQPRITANPGTSVCGVAKITLDAGQGYDGYLWTPGGQTTQTILVWEGGVYTVTVTDANGCTGADMITITVRQPGDPGDFDSDCDVDLQDYVHLRACLTGSSGSVQPECQDADLDADTDVDLSDFAVFQVVFTGSW